MNHHRWLGFAWGVIFGMLMTLGITSQPYAILMSAFPLFFCWSFRKT